MSESFIKKETLPQVFSCEFREMFNNTFFYRTPLVATFEQLQEHILSRVNKNTCSVKQHLSLKTASVFKSSIILNLFLNLSTQLKEV